MCMPLIHGHSSQTLSHIALVSCLRRNPSPLHLDICSHRFPPSPERCTTARRRRLLQGPLCKATSAMTCGPRQTLSDNSLRRKNMPNKNYSPCLLLSTTAIPYHHDDFIDVQEQTETDQRRPTPRGAEG